jgi:hypothetical protein
MERAASRPPPGGGANWAVFFAPLAVTGVVILGALIFVWVSDPEPVERPEVESVDLSERGSAPDSSGFSAVPTNFERASGAKSAEPASVRKVGGDLALSRSEGAPVADDYQDEDEYDDEYEGDAPDGTASAEPASAEQIEQDFEDVHDKLSKAPPKLLQHMPLFGRMRAVVEERQLRKAGMLGEEIQIAPQTEPAVAPDNNSPREASAQPSDDVRNTEPPAVLGAAGAHGN